MDEKRVLQMAEEMDRLILPYFPKEEGMQKKLFESMNYSFEAGGKRIRPLMMQESYKLLGGDENEIDILNPFFAAIEMVHTYS